MGKSEILYNFGLSECTRVKSAEGEMKVHGWTSLHARICVIPGKLFFFCFFLFFSLRIIQL